MIIIGKPYLKVDGDKTFLISHIIDEAQGIETDIFYSSDNNSGGLYLTDSVADTFLVGLLLPAVKYGEDIFVDAPISEKLYYNITNSVLFTLSFIYSSKIRIKVKELVTPSFESSGVGCGCSLGVDSFAAILQHLSPNCPSSYKITHLTYFNVGAMGYVDLEKAKVSYEKDLMLVKSFAKEVGLPVICLESNFSLIYKDFDFNESGDIRNFSAILSLQKLFRKYLYGSSFTIRDFKFDRGQTGYYESLLAPLLSTENCEIVIANPDKTRIDKTIGIIDNPLTQKYLYVCWKELIANRWPDSEVARIKDEHLNCSRCDKCKRTMLAIDLLGYLSKFEGIFDVDYWRTVKDAYVAKVIFYKNNNAFYKDLFTLMKENNYKPSRKSKLLLLKMRLSHTMIWRAIRNVIPNKK